jgi:hypothetical protein
MCEGAKDAIRNPSFHHAEHPSLSPDAKSAVSIATQELLTYSYQRNHLLSNTSARRKARGATIEQAQNRLFASWLEKCCVVVRGDGQQNEDMRYKQAKKSFKQFCEERCLDCPPKRFMELLEQADHKVTKQGKARAHDTFQVTSLQFNQDNVEVTETQDSSGRKFFKFVKNKE